MSNERTIENVMEHQELMLQNSLKEISKSTKLRNDGEGECDYCGKYFKRLVNKACGKCRDEFKLD